MENNSVAGAAVVPRDLLCPLERTVSWVGKTDRNMRLSFLGSDLVQMLFHVFDRRIVAVVIEADSMRADQSAFRAHAVVTKLIYEKCVVQNAEIFQCVDQTAG